MAEKVKVELYLRKIMDLDRITEAELKTLPAYRQERIRAVRDEATKAQIFTAGLLLRDLLGVSKDEDLFFSEKGKPYLKAQGRYFSLSHDDHYVALAVAPVEVGVDIEDRREFSEVLQKRVFTEEERRFIAQDPGRNGVCLWTRLEAVLKLSGEGISGMDHRTFSLLKDDGNCSFRTLTYQESVISIACGEPFELQQCLLSDL